MNVSPAAAGLFELAAEYASFNRIPMTVEWYQQEREADGSQYAPTPVVPRAIHAALCSRPSIAFEDPEREIAICDTCRLAIENGADS